MLKYLNVFVDLMGYAQQCEQVLRELQSMEHPVFARSQHLAIWTPINNIIFILIITHYRKIKIITTFQNTY